MHGTKPWALPKHRLCLFTHLITVYHLSRLMVVPVRECRYRPCSLDSVAPQPTLQQTHSSLGSGACAWLLLNFTDKSPSWYWGRGTKAGQGSKRLGCSLDSEWCFPGWPPSALLCFSKTRRSKIEGFSASLGCLLPLRCL